MGGLLPPEVFRIGLTCTPTADRYNAVVSHLSAPPRKAGRFNAKRRLFATWWPLTTGGSNCILRIFPRGEGLVYRQMARGRVWSPAHGGANPAPAYLAVTTGDFLRGIAAVDL